MKHAFITGVSKGLGNELFKLLLEKGYRVTGLVRKEEDLKKLSGNLHPNAKLVLGDVGQDAVIEKIRNDVPGTVDLLINNAGIGGRGVKLKEINPADVNTAFNIHCTGALRVVQALISNLLAADNPVVINISSRMGSVTNQVAGVYHDLEVSYAYRIAKSSQNMLTACLRAEFGDKIIFVSLHPGKMKTQKAQVDADVEPWESAAQIVEAWENGKIKAENGILELPGNVLPW